MEGTDLNENFFPIVLGSDENAYATARCFNDEYGVKPLCLCSKALAQTWRSKILTVKVIEGFDKPEVFVRELLNELKAREGQGKLLVIPCADYYLELLVRNYDKFEGRIANRFISEELFDKIGTKDTFYALCDELGLYYPPTAICECEDRLNVLNELPFGFPMVMKPENSNATEYLSCSFEGKRKAYFLNSKEEYLDIVSKMNRAGYNGKLILQKLIRGSDATSFVINAYSGTDGKVRFMSVGQVVLEEYSPSMLGNYAGIIPVRKPDLENDVRAFLEGIGYIGISNVDVKYDADTGRYCFFEINPRHGRSSYYIRAAGYNLMTEPVIDAVEGVVSDSIRYPEGEGIWASVPKGTLLKYMPKGEIRERAVALIKKYGITRVQDNPRDNDLLRRIRYRRIMKIKALSFKRYYFDKEKLGK